MFARTALIVLTVASIFSSGCAPKREGVIVSSQTFALPDTLPDLGSAKIIEPGITVQGVRVPHGNSHTDLLVFLPEARSAAKLPCIFIAPAGTRLFHGSDLEGGNPPEYLPYVRAGYAVIAYSLAGNLPEHPTDAQVLAAAEQFKEANGGLNDANLAMDYAAAKFPSVDSNRFYVAGHSSAATVAVYVAAQQRRVKACIAYAPACHLEERLGRVVGLLDARIENFGLFIHNVSPDTCGGNIQCPIFLFHADDDSNVPADDVDRFAAFLKRAGKKVTYVTVPTGNHYYSMIREGIPRAIAWLKKQ